MRAWFQKFSNQQPKVHVFFNSFKLSKKVEATICRRSNEAKHLYKKIQSAQLY